MIKQFIRSLNPSGVLSLALRDYYLMYTCRFNPSRKALCRCYYVNPAIGAEKAKSGLSDCRRPCAVCYRLQAFKCF